MNFLEMINNSPYSCVKGVKMNYEFYIDRSHYHWFLCVRGLMEGSDFPHLTLEASSPDLRTLDHEMFILRDTSKRTYCGKLSISLTDIVSVGDRIIAEMGYYSLFSSNCQHFCNNVLKHFGFSTYPPTFGNEITVVIERERTAENGAFITQILDRLQRSHNSDLEQVLKNHFATALNRMAGTGHN